MRSFTQIERRAFLAGAAASAAAPALSLASATPPTFPKGFLWGVATAGHQIEGNNVNADNWVMENVSPSLFVERSGDAANSFELWQIDLDLVHSLGLNTYRFGVEWSRVEPEPGYFSTAAIDHYRQVADACRKLGITPFVTFNHFTTPRWFAARGGWHNPESPALFARYCEQVAKGLGDRIGFGATLNEPNLCGLFADLVPAPMLEKDRLMQAAAARATGVEHFSAGFELYNANSAAVRTNLKAAHVLGRKAIKSVNTRLPVGVCLSITDEQQAEAGSLRDMIREKYYGEWLRLARDDDFVGVQNHHRRVWGQHGPTEPDAQARRNTLGLEVWPGSLAGAVDYAHSVSGRPVFVTEHGVGSADDTLRAWLIPNALAALQQTMARGVPVLGYLHWSLVDNFEWMFGYGVQFGLFALNRTTFERTGKPSAAIYSSIVRRNSV